MLFLLHFSSKESIPLNTTLSFSCIRDQSELYYYEGRLLLNGWVAWLPESMTLLFLTGEKVKKCFQFLLATHFSTKEEKCSLVSKQAREVLVSME